MSEGADVMPKSFLKKKKKAIVWDGPSPVRRNMSQLAYGGPDYYSALYVTPWLQVACIWVIVSRPRCRTFGRGGCGGRFNTLVGNILKYNLDFFHCFSLEG